MDARLRNLFMSRRKQQHEQHQLRAHPYESSVKQSSPTTGTTPLHGNGPFRLENVALQAPDTAAESPMVPRSRRDSYMYRPQTAPQIAQLERSSRTRSGFSTDAPPNPSIYRYANPYRPVPTTTGRGRSVSALPTNTVSYRAHSTHIDILDAITQLNPSLRIQVQKKIASGKRDYGEDVADRNIAEYGGIEYPQHDPFLDSDDDAAQPQIDQIQVNTRQGGAHWPDDRPELGSQDGSIFGSCIENDGVGDDTTIHNHRDNNSTNQIYTHANQSSTKSTPLTTTANSHTRQQSGNSSYNADGMRGNPRPGWSSSASTEAVSSVIQGPLSAPVPVTNLYSVLRGLENTAPRNDDSLEVAKSSQPIPKTLESRGTQTTPPPPESTASSYYSGKAFRRQEMEDSEADLYDQSTARSRLSRRVILPTPPTSPTNGGSPTASIPRASLDKELPPPPTDESSFVSRRNIRGEESSSAPFHTQEYGRIPKSAQPATAQSPEKGRPSRQSDDKRLREHVLQNLTVRSRLEDVVDTSNTTDTEIIRTQSPAIVHEYVVPKVHEIIEKRISREIHNHDVFHRIQPIIDVEVLPTKHYIPTADGKGLIEIPDTQLPGRHTNWTVQPVGDKLGNITSGAPKIINSPSAKSPEHLSRREPRVQDRQRTMTNGVIKEETVWRHPPQLETGAQETGQTVPLNIYHRDHEDTQEQENGDTASEKYAPSDPYAGSERTFSTNADGEEELLFRDSDLAFDGRLPGLADANPVVEVNASPSRPSTATTRRVDVIGEGKAASALRRMRESKLTNKMGRLSITGEAAAATM